MSYSIIKDYTNKQGKTHQAHFSPSGKYLGPVSKKGNEPILLLGYKTKKVVELPKIEDKPAKMFKLPQIQDKPAIIEDCDESDVEVDCEVSTESEDEDEEQYEEQAKFTKGRYRGLDGKLYEIQNLTAKFAYVKNVMKDGSVREVSQRSDVGYPTGRRMIQGDSIYNGGVKILTTSCKIK
jgi:hypothetical protein